MHYFDDGVQIERLVNIAARAVVLSSRPIGAWKRVDRYLPSDVSVLLRQAESRYVSLSLDISIRRDPLNAPSLRIKCMTVTKILFGSLMLISFRARENGAGFQALCCGV